MAVSFPSATKASTIGWRTPAVIVVCGCLVSMISFGPRATMGFFLTPMSQANGWGRDVFGLALAIQNILWGMGQPFAGAIADRFGTMRVLCAGGTFYAIGLILMAYSTSPVMLDLAAGVFIGFGLAGCSFSVVLAAFGKLLPERWRLLAFGAGTAAGSFGQFLYSPVAVSLMDAFGWQTTLIVFGVSMLLVLPLSLAIATAPAEAGAPHGAAPQSLRQALSEAVGHRSYVLLVLGFFTCGFQLAFITVHMPAYLVDRGLSAQVGGWTIAVIGLFNIVGSLASGWLGNLMPKRYLLSFIYFARAAAVLAFIMFPVTPLSSILFGAVMGLLWLSTVAPTNGIIALIFGTRWLATLAGVAFFSHQVGGFLGVWLGGVVFVRTGSYDAVWWLSVLFGLLSAVINLPIVEKPVVRAAAVPA
ncbi:MAG TPA: MFS transporter [Xanthobacteraceae bacterium]|jgi:MFS family permease|nr:MFS transporter [Xanthobacteraceae bacterium]